MADIFVSYATEDRDRARSLAHALEQCGWTVWWDREIPLGRLYDDVIEQALGRARCALVLWTSTSIASEWVRSEASEAKRRGILVPVFLEPVHPPLAFRLLNGADLTAWEPGTPHAEFERLTNRVRELLAQEPAKSGRVPVPVPYRPTSADGPHRRRRRWWWAMAAAALSLLAVSVLLTSAYSRSKGKAAGATAPGATETASQAAPERPTQGSVPEQTSGTTSPGDVSGLTSALQNALSSAGGQAPMAAMTVFDLKELAVKIIFVSDQQADALAVLGLSAGAVVMEVGPGPALSAGLHAGDVVTSIAGAPVESKEDLRQALRRVGPGTTRYGIRRDKRDLAIDIDCPTCTVP